MQSQKGVFIDKMYTSSKYQHSIKIKKFTQKLTFVHVLENLRFLFKNFKWYTHKKLNDEKYRTSL